MFAVARMRFSAFLPCVILAVLASTRAEAIFLDGEGFYGIRPENQTNPSASESRGMYQATQQSFRLLGQARTKDNLSLNLEFRLFRNPRQAYLGDSPQPEDCSQVEATGETDDKGNPRGENSNRGSAGGCEGRHQDTGQPGYRPYDPHVTKVWAEYAFKYCLLEVGRRGRDWGMGLLLDSGDQPFETSASVFDGVTCAINIQKTQALGFSVGVDRLSETGSSIDIGLPVASDSEKYGSGKISDDLDQLFFTIEYNDRKANAGAAFTRQIGIYFANIFGKETLEQGDERVDAATDIKFADLYTGFYFQNFFFENEVIFRLGKSADPSWSRYGGVTSEENSKPVRNDLNANGIAGKLHYTLSRSGSVIGPAEFNQGTAASHGMFLEYAYAPGDRGGYSREYKGTGLDRGLVGSDRRNKKAEAMAFHRNYKPALILFNGRAEDDDLRIDGIFDPGRVMNASLVALAYEFKSLVHGNFETKFIYAQLNQSIPDAIKTEQLQLERDTPAKQRAPARPIGFSGRSLGYELDLSYKKPIDNDLDLGIAGGVLLPGAAWRTSKKDPPALGYLLQGTATFKF